MNKSKIIYITVPTLNIMGGEERFVLKNAQYFSKKFNVVIVTGDFQPKKTFPGFNKFEIINGKITDKNLAIRHLKLIRFFSKLKLNDYRFIYANSFPSTFIASKNKNVIWYCHTPPRIYHDLNIQYTNQVNFLLRPFFRLFSSFMRVLDKNNLQKIKFIITNSINTRARIYRCYQRKAEVLYPGADFPAVERAKIKFKNYLLSISRLYTLKRVDRIVIAMKYLPDYNLIIVGDGPEKENIRKTIKENKLKNVKIIGSIDERELNRLYLNCFAAIYIPKDEDFGLVPIEANARGKMCIGVDEGGLKETIVDGKTGIFVGEPFENNIAKAVRKLENIKPETRIKYCLENARKFTRTNYYRNLEIYLRQNNL